MGILYKKKKGTKQTEIATNIIKGTLTIKLSCRRTASYLNLGRISRKVETCCVLPSHRLNQECPTRVSIQQAVRLSAPALCCAHSYSIVSRNGDLTISFSSSLLLYSILLQYVRNHSLVCYRFYDRDL